MHGSFSRGDTMNFMAAVGPDFKAGYVDALPVSNADVGMTIAQLLDLHAAAVGGLTDRPGAVGSLAKRNRVKVCRRYDQLKARPERLANGREIPACPLAALF